MAAIIDPPHVSAIEPPTVAPQLGLSAEVNASIDAYLGAGDGMATIMGLTLWVCGALIVLIAVAWVMGVLPGAVKLF
jgi:hypothetical protein